MPPGTDPNLSEARFAAAVEMVTAASAAFRRTARRFSLCPDDAEDAYQRSLEILLTKAPTAQRDELRRWLHTVIKHEALAVRRQRERTVCSEEEAAGAEAVPAPDRSPDEAATGRERVQRTAEALAALKPGEVQCLVLKALGYSYDEIAARTGFSWTKVNRSLTQGRRRFLERFSEIASGTACHHYRPLLSAECDGHGRAADRRMLRAHLAACPGCRAVLREYRTAPAHLAELLPPAVVLPLLDRPGIVTRVHDWLAVTAGDRATAVALKLQHGAEVVGGQKAAAVVASTAAIAGGGVAVQHADPRDADRGVHSEQAAASPAPTPAPDLSPQQSPPPEPDPEPEPAPAPSKATEETQEPAAEFGFEDARAGSGPAPEPAPVSSAEFSGPGGAPAASQGGGEFGP